MDEFISLIDSNTKLVTISAVQFASGFRADLERIGEAARKADALFAVDVIQALGTMPFDLPAQYVDIASSASHKWLCAPEGCGILYLSERAREQGRTGACRLDQRRDALGFRRPRTAFKPNTLAWESGTGASSLFYGLEQSLGLLMETGAERIQSHLEMLTDMLCESIPTDKFKIVSSRAEGEKSQIVTLEPLDGRTSDEIFAELEASNTIVSSRSGRLRISPHFYNNAGDIEKLLNLLGK